MTQDNLQGINHTSGDWALCVDAAQGWYIDANASSGGGVAVPYLNDLLVEIGGSASPFSTAPAVALSRDQILRYDGGAGLWRLPTSLMAAVLLINMLHRLYSRQPSE